MAKKTLTDDINVAVAAVTAQTLVITAVITGGSTGLSIAQRAKLEEVLQKINFQADLILDRLRMIKAAVENI